MHADEVETDPSLVQRLVAGQFPDWADLSIEPVLPLGTDNANYKLGTDKLVRLPRLARTVAGLERELQWLPVFARAVSLATPEPLGRGEPAEGFPFPWAVFTWVEGDNVGVDEIAGPEKAAIELAELVLALRRLDATDAPPGLRRGTLRELDARVRAGAAKLVGRYDAEGLLSAWDESLTAPAWDGPPTWCHCDLDLRSLLFRDGRPSGVLDWGWAGVGDPASDAAVGWKVLPAAARDSFWTALGADDVEIQRASGWTLLQCAGALSYYTPENNPTVFTRPSAGSTSCLVPLPHDPQTGQRKERLDVVDRP